MVLYMVSEVLLRYYLASSGDSVCFIVLYLASLNVDYDAYFVRFVKRRPCTKNEDEDLKDTIAILLHDVGYYCVASCGAF